MTEPLVKQKVDNKKLINETINLCKTASNQKINNNLKKQYVIKLLDEIFDLDDNYIELLDLMIDSFISIDKKKIKIYTKKCYNKCF